jgi:hypothetical protein
LLSEIVVVLGIDGHSSNEVSFRFSRAKRATRRYDGEEAGCRFCETLFWDRLSNL